MLVIFQVSNVKISYIVKIKAHFHYTLIMINVAVLVASIGRHISQMIVRLSPPPAKLDALVWFFPASCLGPDL